MPPYPRLIPQLHAPERWQSGRMYLTRNQAWVQIHRGFESHPLRQNLSFGLYPINRGCSDRFELSSVMPRTVLIDSDRLRELNAAISTANSSKSGQSLPGGG
jgi:hypothetical protein